MRAQRKTRLTATRIRRTLAQQAQALLQSAQKRKQPISTRANISVVAAAHATMFSRGALLRYGAGATAWLLTAHFAAKYDAGALQLFIILTLFTIMFCNLGTRRKGEASAYSVFNRGKRLAGQLDASQFDNEIRHRPTATAPAEEDGFDCDTSSDDDDDAEFSYVPGNISSRARKDGDRYDNLLAALRREAAAEAAAVRARRRRRVHG